MVNWVSCGYCISHIPCLCYIICRTKEQLGYVVECGPRITYRVFGFCFCVQSSKYNPVYLQGRIDRFVNGLEDLLVSIRFFPSHGWFSIWCAYFLLWALGMLLILFIKGAIYYISMAKNWPWNYALEKYFYEMRMGLFTIQGFLLRGLLGELLYSYDWLFPFEERTM